MSGLATCEILRRAFEEHPDRRFERLAGISRSHVYNLRGSRTYRAKRTTWTKTACCGDTPCTRADRDGVKTPYEKLKSLSGATPRFQNRRAAVSAFVKRPLTQRHAPLERCRPASEVAESGLSAAFLPTAGPCEIVCRRFLRPLRFYYPSFTDKNSLASQPSFGNPIRVRRGWQTFFHRDTAT